MKHLLMAALAVSTLAAASAASAQPYGGGYGGGYGRNDGARLEHRIEMSARNGSLSWREARMLRAQVDAVQRLEWRYRQNGLSSWERRDLDHRYDSIRARLRYERSDRDYDGGRDWRGDYDGYRGGGYR